LLAILPLSGMIFYVVAPKIFRNLIGIAGHGPFSHLFDGKLMPTMKMSWKVNHEMTVKGSPIV